MKDALDFTLNDQHHTPFNLFEKLKSNRYVLLIFYPGDFTPVCTKQLIDYNNHLAKLEELNILPVAVNVGSVDSHCKYAETYDFSFPLLSDQNKVVSMKYQAINFSGGNKRKVVLIDNNHKILYEYAVFPLLYQKIEKILKKAKIKNKLEF
jgi:peroxiredoxin Q/BCP